MNIGVFVDETYDIGRIEDVHFNPWYSSKTPFCWYQTTHGRAFVMGRSDWCGMRVTNGLSAIVLHNITSKAVRYFEHDSADRDCDVQLACREYVFNTFAFGYAIGYHFIERAMGSMNGNFLGIGQV